jgi:(p)ppGpp synthase/HD superfamily hydrolase
MLDRAISITSQAFEGKFDKGGQPYILHCLHVMNQMDENDMDLRCVAVLHDLLEDTEWTELDLLMEGFNGKVVKAIVALTKAKGQSYDDYIQQVKDNEMARKVKIADLKHNSDITRMKGVTDKDMERIGKYFKAYKYLTDV